MPVKADPAISPLPQAEQQGQCDAGQGAGGKHPAHTPAQPEPPARQQGLDHSLASRDHKEKAGLITHPQPRQRHPDHPLERQGTEDPAHIRQTGLPRQQPLYLRGQQPQHHQTGQRNDPYQAKHPRHHLFTFGVVLCHASEAVEGVHQTEAENE